MADDMITCRIGWWNVGNLFDDVDDPTTRDPVPSRKHYLRDISELAQVIGAGDTVDLLGLGEVENTTVLKELCQELRWHRSRRDYQLAGTHHNSRDPRGIDIGTLIHHPSPLRVDRTEAMWPNDRDAVRPVVQLHCRLAGHRIRIAFIHSKSRRSGPSHPRDPLPGSRIRFAYGRLLRSLAIDAASDGVGLVVCGDFNDEPTSPSLTDGAGAILGRPHHKEQPKRNRLYNLTLEAKHDSPGTHQHRGRWAYLDQVLVSGSLLLPDQPLHLSSRAMIRTDGPLLYRGAPNRWYSDHLPLTINISTRPESRP